MGLFSGKSEEEKKREVSEKLKVESDKIKNALQALGIDLGTYSEDEIREKNKMDLTVIASTLSLDTAGKVLSALNMSNYERIALSNHDTFMRQNWILIRQAELQIRLLEKILDTLNKKEVEKS